MNFKSIIVTSFFLITTISICIASMHAKQHFDNNYEWSLIWKDDFDEDSLDMNVWGYMKRRSDESRKYHSSNPACYELRDGKLIIKGIKNPDLSTDTAQYLTGAITTEGKKAFSPPARIEIKAKIGNAQGAWPAFWMLPFKKEKGWPSDGEIDIMEHLNFDNFVYQTVHSEYTTQNRDAKPQRSIKTEIKSHDFNIYRVDILPDCISFFVNGKETLTYPKIDSLLNRGEFPFFKDWYLMLDMQLGGSWVGCINSNEIPVQMEIDWVKYYTLKEH
ncbi:glycoside hydrolase family 16 protein [uncultured Duncaniella sp.]|uniref:glycoside hydrolase family 16 protein n=1 Tax=uncultured Duncaniella sp. TaxID=2768039 RepID=UPI0026331732|nr:glycoside hydrolase family 16 protein [uncultured Duncaniella sp.]